LSIYGNKFTGVKQTKLSKCSPERSGAKPSVGKFFPEVGRTLYFW